MVFNFNLCFTGRAFMKQIMVWVEIWSALASHMNSPMLFRVTHNNLLQPVADSSHHLPSILHPTFSHFSCSDSITEHFSPLWIKRVGQAAGLCTPAHSLVPTQRGSCIKRETKPLSPTPSPAGWVSTHSTAPSFPCQMLRMLSPPRFSPCATHLAGSSWGFRFLMSCHSHPGKGTP